MLYSAQSSCENYSILKANINVPWECKNIKYYVSSLSMNVNILVSTVDDYIIFENDQDKTCTTISFTDKYNITCSDIEKLFASSSSLISLKYDPNKRVFKISTTKDMTLISMTHRAALLTGMFNVKLPLKIEADNGFECPDIPILDYGNKFYLVSLQGNAIYTNQDYTPSVIASIDTFIKDGLPMLVNFDSFNKPIKIKINTDGLKYIEMQLVDFMFQPIIVKSPVFVTLKIKPVDKS